MITSLEDIRVRLGFLISIKDDKVRLSRQVDKTCREFVKSVAMGADDSLTKEKARLIQKAIELDTDN